MGVLELFQRLTALALKDHAAYYVRMMPSEDAVRNHGPSPHQQTVLKTRTKTLTMTMTMTVTMTRAGP